MRERADTKVLPSTPVDRLRLYAVFGIFALGFLYVAGGLAFRQLIQSSDLKEQSDNQSRRIVLRPPARGRIYDRNGFVLVDNRARWSVKADLAALQKEFRSEYLRLLAAERARQAVQVDTERVMELARVTSSKAGSTRSGSSSTRTNGRPCGSPPRARPRLWIRPASAR